MNHQNLDEQYCSLVFQKKSYSCQNTDKVQSTHCILTKSTSLSTPANSLYVQGCQNYNEKKIYKIKPFESGFYIFAILATIFKGYRYYFSCKKHSYFIC